MTNTADRVKELTQQLTLVNLENSRDEVRNIARGLSGLPEQEANEARQAIEGFYMVEQRLFGM
jgi:hypothetical protein